jgi:hypothetical protein
MPPALEILALDTATPQIRAPGSGDTYAAPRALAVTANPTNTSLIAGSGYSLTGSDSTPMLDFSGTWNTSGTPTALRLNLTDTASNAASNLLDLQTGGVSRFRVRKDGAITTGLGFSVGSTLTMPTASLNVFPNDYSSVGIALAGGSGLYGYSGGGGFFISGGEKVCFFVGSDRRFVLLNGYHLGFRSDASTADADLKLFRDAANTLAQRNGTNAQAFRIYNTYTAADNFERGKIEWASNVLRIGTEKGTVGGTARALELQTDGTTRLTIGTVGNVWIPANLAGGISNLGLMWQNGTGSIYETLRYATSPNRIWISSASMFAWGTTSSFPALKRDSAALQVRLADDSANAALESASVKTDAPAGGTSGTWKLGVAATVTPTSPNRTIEVDIGGTIYYIHAKTTND